MALEAVQQPLTTRQVHDLQDALQGCLSPLESYLELLSGAQGAICPEGESAPRPLLHAGDAGDIGRIILQHCKRDFHTLLQRMADAAPHGRHAHQKDDPAARPYPLGNHDAAEVAAEHEGGAS